jgi:hypothetical protein
MASSGGFPNGSSDNDKRPYRGDGPKNLRIDWENHSEPDQCCLIPFHLLRSRCASDFRPWLNLEPVPFSDQGRDIFYLLEVAEVYRQALPSCSDLFLTLVKRVVEGDTFFRNLKNRFVLEKEMVDNPEFKILHYRKPGLLSRGANYRARIFLYAAIYEHD